VGGRPGQTIPFPVGFSLGFSVTFYFSSSLSPWDRYSNSDIIRKTVEKGGGWVFTLQSCSFIVLVLDCFPRARTEDDDDHEHDQEKSRRLFFRARARLLSSPREPRTTTSTTRTSTIEERASYPLEKVIRFVTFIACPAVDLLLRCM
jgi:hypothetical protein